ncbi:MAG: hypothetical protein MHM6MM_006156 [Cercozoa sp. M6MM]
MDTRVQGVVVLDREGQRVLSRHYGEAPIAGSDVESQRRLETSLFTKVVRSKAALHDVDILLHQQGDSVVVTAARVVEDVVLLVLGDSSANEPLLAEFANGLLDALRLLLHDDVSRASLLSHMSLLLIVLDEMIEDGLMVETDGHKVEERVNAPGSDFSAPTVGSANEPTLLNAVSSLARSFWG